MAKPVLLRIPELLVPGYFSYLSGLVGEIGANCCDRKDQMIRKLQDWFLQYWTLIAVVLIMALLRRLPQSPEIIMIAVVVSTGFLILGWHNLQKNEISRIYSHIYLALFVLILAISGLLLLALIPAFLYLVIAWFFIEPNRGK